MHYSWVPDRMLLAAPSSDIGSMDVAESLKTTIRWDEGLRADAERCAKERGIAVAEFNRQAIAHYVAWCAAQREAREQAEKAPKPDA